jgi:hypothetical protein
MLSVPFSSGLWACLVLLTFLPQTSTRPTEDSKIQIKLERTGCFGVCPIYSVTLFSDGRVIYEGKYNVAVIGIHTKKISPVRVQEIAKQAASIGYFSFDQRINMAFDVPRAITQIRIGDRLNRVEHFLMGKDDKNAPPGLTALEEMIDQVADIREWTNCGRSPSAPKPCAR